jgi:hypothetical protein
MRHLNYERCRFAVRPPPRNFQFSSMKKVFQLIFSPLIFKLRKNCNRDEAFKPHRHRENRSRHGKAATHFPLVPYGEVNEFLPIFK